VRRVLPITGVRVPGDALLRNRPLLWNRALLWWLLTRGPLDTRWRGFAGGSRSNMCGLLRDCSRLHLCRPFDAGWRGFSNPWGFANRRGLAGRCGTCACGLLRDRQRLHRRGPFDAGWRSFANRRPSG
jgi:hypothetical protein